MLDKIRVLLHAEFNQRRGSSMNGHLKQVTNTDSSPFAQGRPGELWEVLVQSTNSEIFGVQAIVVSYDLGQFFAINLHLEEGRKLPHHFHAVMSKGRLCLIPVKNKLEPRHQEDLYLMK